MEIREYQTNDCEELAELFFNTVHFVNAKNYTKEQLNVWATGKFDIDVWNQSFLNHYTLVAIEKNMIVGFGDIDNTGYLDRIYVHKNYQGLGIATALCDRLEKQFTVEKIKVHASITAKPFFEKRGYKVIKEQEVIRQNVSLINYLMEK